jgi:hypothetical protein
LLSKNFIKRAEKITLLAEMGLMKNILILTGCERDTDQLPWILKPPPAIGA